MKIIEGSLKALNAKIGIVISRFNENVTRNLLEGAIRALKQHQIADENITVIWVPGAFEIPCIAQTLAKDKKVDAIICLGVVIKGDTDHYEYVCSGVTSGIAQLSLTYQIPITFGILTTNTTEQALDRAGGKSGNKGYDVACTALEMCNIIGLVSQGC